MACKVGTVAEVGKEFGMIRFGSRVDFFLPLDAEINVKLFDVVRGQMSVLAYLNDNYRILFMDNRSSIS